MAARRFVSLPGSNIRCASGQPESRAARRARRSSASSAFRRGLTATMVLRFPPAQSRGTPPSFPTQFTIPSLSGMRRRASESRSSFSNPVGASCTSRGATRSERFERSGVKDLDERVDGPMCEGPPPVPLRVPRHRVGSRRIDVVVEASRRRRESWPGLCGDLLQSIRWGWGRATSSTVERGRRSASLSPPSVRSCSPGSSSASTSQRSRVGAFEPPLENGREALFVFASVPRWCRDARQRRDPDGGPEISHFSREVQSIRPWRDRFDVPGSTRSRAAHRGRSSRNDGSLSSPGPVHPAQFTQPSSPSPRPAR
jgi:hypothetical protein